MNRLPGWRKRVELLIDNAKRRPLQYGVFDCGPEWAGRLVEALLGIDPAARFRGLYSSPEEAVSLIHAEGCADLGELVSKLLAEATGNTCDIHPSSARLFDLAGIAADGPFGVALAIVNGERLLVPGETMMRHVDRRAATRAWRLGDAA